jgi:hypothetical protein
MHGWVFRRDFFVWNGRDRTVNDARAALATGRTNTVNFWYRTSPAPMVSSPNSFFPAPPIRHLVLSGMRLAFFDPHGRLSEFHAIPHSRGQGTYGAAARLGADVRGRRADAVRPSTSSSRSGCRAASRMHERPGKDRSRTCPMRRCVSRRRRITGGPCSSA